MGRADDATRPDGRETRPEATASPVAKVLRAASWGLGVLTVALALRLGASLGTRLLAAGAAAAVVLVFARLAGGLARSAALGWPVSGHPRARASPAVFLRPGAETWVLREYVRLALRSAGFFDRFFSAYLGSLALGRPLRSSDILWDDSPAKREARRAFAAAAGRGDPGGDLPRRGWWRRPPSARELEELVGRMERAYELARRRPHLG